MGTLDIRLFCSAIRKRVDVREIDHEQIVQCLIGNPNILYENAAQNCDKRCKKYVLRGLPFFLRAGGYEDFWGGTKNFGKFWGGTKNF